MAVFCKLLTLNSKSRIVDTVSTYKHFDLNVLDSFRFQDSFVFSNIFWINQSNILFGIGHDWIVKIRWKYLNNLYVIHLVFSIISWTGQLYLVLTIFFRINHWNIAIVSMVDSWYVKNIKLIYIRFISMAFCASKPFLKNNSLLCATFWQLQIRTNQWPTKSWNQPIMFRPNYWWWLVS